MIEVVGLGNNKNEITLKGVDAIKNAELVFLKTALTETVEYFRENNIAYTSFDNIYESSESFDELDNTIVDILLKNKRKKVVFCVNGSGFEDRAVCILANKIKVNIIPSSSLACMHKKPSTSFIQMSAYDVISNNGFNYDTRLPLTIVDVDNKYIASELKLVLSNILGDDQEIYFNSKLIKVYELDRQRVYNYKSQINIDPINTLEKKRFNFIDLYLIMKRLRAKDGCPWDRVQTHKSIRENLIEEAYELVDAIDKEDIENMIEETGDMFMQCIFHCVIGEDSEEYNYEDAISRLCQKLIFRHPHVFGEDKALSTEAALSSWDSAKAKEKNYTDIQSKIDKIPEAFPSLLKTKKILSISKKENMLYRTQEEIINDIENIIKNIDNQEDKEIQFGKLLFNIVQLSMLEKIDPEIALNEIVNKYIVKLYKIKAKLEKEKQIDKEKLKKLWEELSSEY